MELEAKLTLSSMEDMNKIADGLKLVDGNFKVQLEQDIFFDGCDGELEKRDAVFRLRKTTMNSVSDGPVKYSATVKEHSEVSQGQGMRWEHTDILTAEQAASFSQNPNQLLDGELRLATADSLCKKGIAKLGHVGEISTTRMTFQWLNCEAQKGLTIRLDKSDFPFGTRYELEVPHITVPMEDILDELGRILKNLGVTNFTKATDTKFQTLRGGTKQAAAKPHMSVEAKLVLNNQNDFCKVHNALSSNKQRGESQENIFLDTHSGTLSQRGAMLRVRLDMNKTLCVLTIKEHADVQDGGSLCWAQEEAIPWSVGAQLRENPNLLFDGLLSAGHHDSTVVNALKSKFCIREGSLVCLGGFNTLREHYSWPSAKSQPGLAIRLDKTTYPFGDRYELEVPNIRVPVEDVVGELDEILKALDVSYVPGSKSKFNQFRDGVAKSFVSPHVSSPTSTAPHSPNRTF